MKTRSTSPSSAPVRPARAAAILLARAGWSVALIERQAFPRRKVCGECVAASNLALLDALGVGAEFEAHAGAELRRVALMRGDETIVATLPPGEGAIAGAGRSAASISTPCSPTPREAAGATRLQPWRCSRSPAAPATSSLRVAIDAGAGRRRRAARRPRRRRARSWEPLPSEREAAPRAARAGPTCSPSRRTSAARRSTPTCCRCCRSRRLRRHGRRRRRHRDARRLHPRRSAAGVARGAARRSCRRRVRGDAAARMRRRRAALAARPRRRMARERAASARRSPRPSLGDGDDGVFRIGNAAGEAHPIVGEGISMALQSAFVLAALIAPAACRARRPATRRGAAARARRLRGALAAPLRAPPARRRRVRARRDAAGARAAWPGRWFGAGRRPHRGARLSDKTRCAPEATAGWPGDAGMKATRDAAPPLRSPRRAARRRHRLDGGVPFLLRPQLLPLHPPEFLCRSVLDRAARVHRHAVHGVRRRRPGDRLGAAAVARSASGAAGRRSPAAPCWCRSARG